MNIFEGGFEEPTERFPDKIFTEVTKDFSIATNGLVSLGLIEVSGAERVAVSVLRDKGFRFKVVLMSTYLQGYSFEVFEFGYDVSLFPVAIDIEDGIGGELRGDGIPYSIVNCDTEEEFEQQLKEIFETQRFRTTVGGLMKIANSKKPMSPISQAIIGNIG